MSMCVVQKFGFLPRPVLSKIDLFKLYLLKNEYTPDLDTEIPSEERSSISLTFSPCHRYFRILSLTLWLIFPITPEQQLAFS